VRVSCARVQQEELKDILLKSFAYSISKKGRWQASSGKTKKGADGLAGLRRSKTMLFHAGKKLKKKKESNRHSSSNIISPVKETGNRLSSKREAISGEGRPCSRGKGAPGLELK